ARASTPRSGSAATRSAASTFASITGRSPSVARSARASNKGLDAVRTPAVSGSFYPRTKRELERAVRELLEAVPPTSPAPARAAVAPHAGYVYSGLTAAHVFARLAIPPVVVILAPNHTGVCGARGGEALAGVTERWSEPVLLLASSDLTHYEPARVAERKDRLALEAVAALDGEELLRRCRREGISMCGRAPTATVVAAARTLGAARA